MPFKIIRDDITKVHADAIVNTANPEPVYASGTDSAVYRAAGEKKLLRERKKIGHIEPGEAAVTPAFRLHARFIIHTVGPVWIDGEHGEYELLSSCYRKSLQLARHLGCRSIAFSLISTGVYGFPKDRALDIALREFSAFLTPEEDDPRPEEEMDITLVVFDRKAFDLSSTLVKDVEQYIDENYVEARREQEYGAGYGGEGFYREETYGAASDGESPYRAGSSPSDRGRRRRRSFFRDTAAGRPSVRKDTEESLSGQDFWDLPDYDLWEESDAAAEGSPLYSVQEQMPPRPESPFSPQAPDYAAANVRPEYLSGAQTSGMHARRLEDVIAEVGETFQESLLRMIDQRGLTDTQVYKRANMDRRLFSKIRSNPNYSPKRQTAIALGLALELNMDEMRDLLGKAGIALSPSSKFDLIISFCIQNRIYDIIRVNSILFDYDQPLL